MRVSVVLLVLIGKCVAFDIHFDGTEDAAAESLVLERLGYHDAISYPVLAQFSVNVAANVTTHEFTRDTTLQKKRHAAHFNVFSKEIARLMTDFPVRQVQVSLTQGVWKSDLWTSSSYGPARPAGATVIAVMDMQALHKSGESMSSAWRRLVHALGGLICSSLSLMGDTRRHAVIPPDFIPGDTGTGGASWVRSYNNTETRIIYGSLPNEALCTENLAPVAKFLPCKREAGLMSLLDPVAMAAAPHKSLLLTLSRRPLDPDNAYSSKMEMFMKVAINYVVHSVKSGELGSDVFDLLLAKRSSLHPCMAMTNVEAPPQFYVRHADATKETVLINSLTPIINRADLMNFLKLNSRIELPIRHGIVQVHRDETASMSDPDAALRTRCCWNLYFDNYDSKHDISISYHERMTPFMIPLIHTLRVTLTKTDQSSPHVIFGTPAIREFGIKWTAPVPSIDDSFSISFTNFTLPVDSSLSMSFDVIKSHVRRPYFGFSVDKGEDISSGIMIQSPVYPSYNDNPAVGEDDGPLSPWIVQFSTNLLILIAIPDFSMPFNVVAIASTGLLFLLGHYLKLSTVRDKAHVSYLNQQITAHDNSSDGE